MSCKARCLQLIVQRSYFILLVCLRFGRVAFFFFMGAAVVFVAG